LLSMYERIMGTLPKDFDIHMFLCDVGWLDSDYVKYDKKLLVIMFGIYVVWKLVQKTPFYQDILNRRELARLKLILQSLQQFVIIIGNDVFLMKTKVPSGVSGTTWLNCIHEAILEVLQLYYCMHRKAYADSPPAYCNFVSMWCVQYPFFQNVALINYGDDNGKFVKPIVRSVYTHSSIMEFADFICMGITPAKKTESQIVFKPVTEILFLKRTPVWNERTKKLVGRLELKSIAKMLAFTDSHDPNWEFMVIDQALRELAFYPTTVFDNFCQMMFIDANQDSLIDKIMSETEWKVKRDDDLPFFSECSWEHVQAVPGFTSAADLNNIKVSSAGLF